MINVEEFKLPSAKKKILHEVPDVIQGVNGGWDALGFNTNDDGEVPDFLMKTSRRISNLRKSIGDIGAFMPTRGEPEIRARPQSGYSFSSRVEIQEPYRLYSANSRKSGSPKKHLVRPSSGDGRSMSPPLRESLKIAPARIKEEKSELSHTSYSRSPTLSPSDDFDDKEAFCKQADSDSEGYATSTRKNRIASHVSNSEVSLEPKSARNNDHVLAWQTPQSLGKIKGTQKAKLRRRRSSPAALSIALVADDASRSNKTKMNCLLSKMGLGIAQQPCKKELMLEKLHTSHFESPSIKLLLSDRSNYISTLPELPSQDAPETTGRLPSDGRSCYSASIFSESSFEQLKRRFSDSEEERHSSPPRLKPAHEHVADWVPTTSAILCKKRYFVAAQTGKLAEVQSWVGNGGCVDVFDPKNGCTALHYACMNGQVDVATFLLEAGANPAICDSKYKQTPFQLAFYKGSMKCLGIIKVCLEYVSKTKKRTEAIYHYKKSLHYSDSTNVGASDFFLKTEDFLRHERLLPFHYWKEGKLLVPAAKIPENSLVLFISHRWEHLNHPDPKSWQFGLIKTFLTEKVMDFVWIDYSCLELDLNSDTIKDPVINLPTVLFIATHMLLLTRVCHVKEEDIDSAMIPVCKYKNWPISDLQDYISRGWCRFEVLAGQMLGLACYCHFMFGNLMNTFVRLPARSDVHDSSGILGNDWYSTLEAAAVFSLPKTRSSDENMALWEGCLRTHWEVNYALDATGALQQALAIFEPKLQSQKSNVASTNGWIVSKSLKGMLSSKDLKESKLLRRFAKKLGNFSIEEDRLLLLQNLFLFMEYATNSIVEAHNIAEARKQPAVCIKGKLQPANCCVM